ncbi:MAG TPA: hypothetical protein VFY92_03030 [Hyphomicrobiaceae bacterium]|nr:hypothetical protein [Hyphomicrobiaceae bacterium]
MLKVRSPMIPARGWLVALAGFSLMAISSISTASARPSGSLAVDVTNASEPEQCAEKDNVTLNLMSPAVRHFQIEAAHPAYIGSLQRDSFEADWTGCTLPDDPKHEPGPGPKRTTLYEEYDLWVVGQTYPRFWRPATATVRIGERVAKDIHLLQVWLRRPMGGEEVLVLYPQDGYWRLRPRAPAGMAPTAFGSSFLIGPVEEDGRPVVKIKEVAFDPKARAFNLSFERGGTATVAMAKVDQLQHLLDVTFDTPIARRPFTTLRSMYVTERVNDVARIEVLDAGAKGWREEGIMAFKGAKATHVWAGRVTPSRHNTSSPDMTFRAFSAGIK